MNILTLSGDKGELVKIDVTNVDGWAGGDLEHNGGNLYIAIDGKEFGSLWIDYDEKGEPSVTLGQFDPETGDWESRATIRHLPD